MVSDVTDVPAPEICVLVIDGLPVGGTVSIGVAAFPTHGMTPEELIETADKAMYRAKSLGRDRVCGQRLTAAT